MRGVAFCPAHITGFFKADVDNSRKIEEIGSMGAGFSIKDGVTTTVHAKRVENGKSNFRITTSGYQTDDLVVSEFVINEFFSICNERYFLNVHHDIKIPVSYGLGCSGAVALSLSYALDQALGTKLTKEKLAQIAHKAEIKCGTGLGDVLASFYGGFEIRTKAGAPGFAAVEKIPIRSKAIVVCFSPISTKKFLHENLSKINGLGGKMVKKLITTRDCNQFQDMSIEFAKYVKVMTPTMNRLINELHQNGIRCGVALFGETVFSLVTPAQEKTLFDILKKYENCIVIQSKIDNIGARLQ